MLTKKHLLGFILTWLALGLTLEFLLGVKHPSYLDDPIRREMWRLAHAHGVLLTLVYLNFDTHWPFQRELEQRLAQWGLILMPLGFFLGGIQTTETDPFIGVLLAPLGGVLFIAGLAANLFFSSPDPS